MVDDSKPTDATLPAHTADATLSADGHGAATPVVVRGGEDYGALVTIEPKHYLVGRELARGGMGRILVARDRRLGRDVAIKELLYESASARARFEREARITARLQHPAIVSVHEAGTWPGGEPFYAMKLVSGESLDKAIAARAGLAGRLGLLPNLIAVVDALAYAHSEQVIHRDLKPGNVLVGSFGETVVIDWGLAKDLVEGADAEPALGPYRVAGSTETVAGSVVGTPAYMPPEQASGERVDERADVYALGAMLYQLLTGQPPHTGKSTDEILARVIAGPSPRVASCAPDAPPDLTTIVEKAMAHDPSERYPSARELAEDLRRFQTGQLVGSHRYSARELVWRWVRRHRTAVAVGAVAAALLVAGGAVAVQRIVAAQRVAEDERDVARAQRAIAQDSRFDAEDLVGFMLGDLRDKLEPAGRLELLEDAARKAVDYYRGRGEPLAPAEELKLAKARRNLGDVLLAKGQGAEARREYEASRAVAERLGSADPASTDARWSLALSHEKLADLASDDGDGAGALAGYRRALALLEELAAAEPSSTTWKLERAHTHQSVGDALGWLGDPGAALAEYRTARDLIAAVLAAEPDRTALRPDLAASTGKIGEALIATGELGPALAEFRGFVSDYQELVAAEPRNARWQRELAVGHKRIGEILARTGDHAGALAEHRLAVPGFERLAAGDPTDASRALDLAAAIDVLGDALLATGDHAGGLTEYRRMLPLLAELATRDPARTTRAALGVAHGKVGGALYITGDVEGAEQELRVYRDTLVELSAAEPSNIPWKREAGIARQALADVLRSRGAYQEALVELEAARQAVEEVAQADLTNPFKQHALAYAHETIGDTRLLMKDGAGAIEAYRAQQAVFARLAEADPSNPTWRRGLAVVHDKVGNALVVKGDPAVAIEEYRAGIAIFEELAAAAPDDPQHPVDLAELRGHLAAAERAR